MVQATKGTSGAPSSSTHPNPSSNGVITAKPPPGAPSVNRKKQKRRQKLAAKQAAEQERAALDPRSPQPSGLPARGAKPPALPDSSDQRFSMDDDDESDDDDILYPPHPGASQANGHMATAGASPGGARKKSRKKKKNKGAGGGHEVVPPHHHSHATFRGHVRDDDVWNTSTHEERERIKQFWLSLGEDQRKSLVKIEKEAVLRKMKEQQKHTCSCAVCGRKRTAIEEELEVLYDAYYDELEQYGHFLMGPSSQLPMLPPKCVHQPANRSPEGPHSHAHAHADKKHPMTVGAYPEDDEDEVDEYSEEYEDDYSVDSQDPMGQPPAAVDLINFGNSLTVKGGILTVADDLLKNDGKKFIDMMEQLAERRMAREVDASIISPPHDPYPAAPFDRLNAAGHEGEEFDEEEEEFDSVDEYDDEEDDDIDFLTEEQRMEEGRRMFQIFAARMFEQRVLQAYKEKVAAERQQKLIEELEAEQSQEVKKEAKKQREAQKKKEKKQQQRQAKAEEKARKDAEKAAEEAAIKAEEAKKQEELRLKREEARKKKEADRKAQETERLKKEAERQKKLQEERDRQQEAERRAREQKAADKRVREEAKRKEREKQEAKEREARERKAQAERAKREKEEKLRADRAKAEKEAQDKARRETLHAPHVPPAKRVLSGPSAVAVPPMQRAPSNLASAYPVATPQMAKAATPVRPKQGSGPASKASSPKTPQLPSGQHTTTASPAGSVAMHRQLSNQSLASKQHITQAGAQAVSNPPNFPCPASPLHVIPPPPGITPPNVGAFGLAGFNTGTSYTIPGLVQTPQLGQAQLSQGFGEPMFPGQQGPSHGQFRPFPPNSIGGPAPGMPAPGLALDARGFPNAPPGFPQMPTMGGAMFTPIGPQAAQHGRQASGSSTHELGATSTTPPHPIQRPAPIQRPGSVSQESPHDHKLMSTTEVDDLTRHLGSSALLDDEDDPIPTERPRRLSQTHGTSVPPGLSHNHSNLPGSADVPLKKFPPTHVLQQMLNDAPSALLSRPPTDRAWLAPGMAAQWSTGHAPVLPNRWPQPLTHYSPAKAFPQTYQPTAPTRSRAQQIRLNVVDACISLTEATPKGLPGSDGYHPTGAILPKVEHCVSPPVTMDELMAILETEGTPMNGGGLFVLVTPHGKRNADGQPDNEEQQVGAAAWRDRLLVRWDPEMPKDPRAPQSAFRKDLFSAPPVTAAAGAARSMRPVGNEYHRFPELHYVEGTNMRALALSEVPENKVPLAPLAPLQAESEQGLQISTTQAQQTPQQQQPQPPPGY